MFCFVVSEINAKGLRNSRTPMGASREQADDGEGWTGRRRTGWNGAQLPAPKTQVLRPREEPPSAAGGEGRQPAGCWGGCSWGGQTFLLGPVRGHFPELGCVQTACWGTLQLHPSRHTTTLSGLPRLCPGSDCPLASLASRPSLYSSTCPSLMHSPSHSFIPACLCAFILLARRQGAATPIRGLKAVSKREEEEGTHQGRTSSPHQRDNTQRGVVLTVHLLAPYGSQFQAVWS